MPEAADPDVLRALTRSVAARGYRATSVADVIEIAGVGRNSFYARFRNKEQCFVAAYDGIMAQAIAEVTNATRRLGSPVERIEAPLAALLAVIARAPDAARVALLESHAAGEAARDQRDWAMDAFGAHLRRALSARDDAQARELSAAICGSIETYLVARLLAGRAAELPGASGALAAWAATYGPLLAAAAAPLPAPPPRPPSRRRGHAPGTLVPAGPSGRSGLPPGPKREPRDFIASNLHDRLLDAVATIAARDGYDALTVAAVVAEATTSRRSFYEHFASIPEAFQKALLLGAEGAMAATLPAYASQTDWRAAIVAGAGAFCGFLAEEVPFAVCGLVEALSAGAESIQVRDQALGAFSALLADAYRREPAVPAAQIPLIAELTAGAMLALGAADVRAGATAQLPDRVPLLSVLALTPAIGADAARSAVHAAIAAA